MSLKLIHGPPNSGRAGLIRSGFVAALDRDPILVVPTVDDVYAFERELCEGGATLGGAVMTFGGLFRAVAAGSGSPPGIKLTRAQRLGTISAAVAECRERLRPLRRSAARPGFARSFAVLLDELQGAGLEPDDVAAGAATLEGSSYLADVALLYSSYAQTRDRLGRVDEHGVARQAVALLEAGGSCWERPVFLYGLDDLTGNQLALIRSLAASAEVTVALPYEPGNTALAARSSLLEKLRSIGVGEETATEPDPANTANPLLFHLERGFGAAQPPRRSPGEGGLLLLRSAGERGEAEAIATEVARLLAAGADPVEIAIVLRDPARRGPLLASVLEAYGVPTALEAEVPVSGTSVGGALIALMESEFGGRRASDLLRFLRGPCGASPRKVDWFERDVRRGRAVDAAAALALWEERNGAPPRDLADLRAAASEGPAALSAAVARLAQTMASRPLRADEDGPTPGRGDGLELRAAAAIAGALLERAELGLAPQPAELAGVLSELQLRAWSGPVEGRVRIASPYRLRAARFDHVFVGSLQDGEFPRHDGGGDPFLSDAQCEALALEPRRDAEAEERYLFHSCLALPRRTLALSHRDSDENGVAASRSPLLDELRGLLEPAPNGMPDRLEESITRGGDLAQVVHRVAEAPSAQELARAVASHGAAADAASLLAASGAPPSVAESVAARLARSRLAEEASRAPGPLRNEAPIESLAAVGAYGGTTLEMFDVCSYRWFVDHELSPVRLEPEPEGLMQGTLMHAALQRLYEERPGGDPMPRPPSLAAWAERGNAILAALAAERELGSHPAERAIFRRVEGLLARFLTEEARRDPSEFEPWLLEARFGENEEAQLPPLELDEWRLHGAIDRVDRDRAGRAVVIDYKLSREVVAGAKLEERAKLQLQLYLLAVSELWGQEPVAGLYHPLRGTSSRQPRGLVLDAVAPALASYGLVRTDLVDSEEFEELLRDARRRAGEIVARMRRGDIRRDPGPRRGLPGHDVCPSYCDFATICRRDRAPAEPQEEAEGEER